MTHRLPPETPQLASVIELDQHRARPNGEGARILARVTYTVPEVATLLGISRATTYVLLKTGQIPARRIGSRWIIACQRFNTWLDDDPTGAQR